MIPKKGRLFSWRLYKLTVKSILFVQQKIRIAYQRRLGQSADTKVMLKRIRINLVIVVVETFGYDIQKYTRDDKKKRKLMALLHLDVVRCDDSC